MNGLMGCQGRETGTSYAVDGRTVQERFPASTGSVPRARMMVRSSHDQLPPGVQDRLELVVSELAANAVHHAGTPFEVRLTIGSTVRLEVCDGSPVPPVVRDVDVHDVSGRGLLIVDRFADRWGHEEGAAGKTVWAELDPG